MYSRFLLKTTHKLHVDNIKLIMIQYNFFKEY